MTLAMLGANLAGATAVTAFVVFVLPAPLGFHGASDRLLSRNAIGLAIFMPFSMLTGTLWSRRRFAGPAKWFLSGEAPTGRDREVALRAPLSLLVVNATMWALAGVVFVALNAPASRRLALTSGVSALLGGIVTCAIAYFVSERLMRSVTARSLAGHPPLHPVLPGVAVRMVLAWTLGAGVPLAAITLIALHVLTDQTISGRRLATAVLYLGIAGLVLGLLAVFFAAQSIADPLSAIRRALDRVRAGDNEVELPIYDGSEVGLVQAGFNEMVAGLREREQLRDLFGRHVGREVARDALDRGVALGGETRDVAALFVDVIGSTTLAARRPPQEVVGLLNRFFEIVVDVVRKHGGAINKFEGDAALCVFGAPVADQEPRAAALASARELSGRLEREVLELKAAIGVSAGNAVAGNVGASERFEYTVIGDPINEAARLSELAKSTPGRVLASEAALAGAAVVERDCWRLGESVTLRGREAETRLALPRD